MKNSISTVGGVPFSPSSMSVAFANSSEESQARYLQYMKTAHSHEGPTHVSATSNEKSSRVLERRRKFSQLYTGIGIYHHSLSYLYDHMGDSTFYHYLDEEKRKKHQLTPAIQIKIERIKEARMRKEQRTPFKCTTWLKEQFYKTTLGSVFRSTPR
jgi:hypothetical protein